MKLIYLLEYLLNGKPSRTFLQPVDCHGVIMEEVGEAEDPSLSIMRGKTLQGKELKIPIGAILKIEEYTIGHRTNKGVRRENASAERVERVIEQNTDKSTGEVKGVAYIRDNNDPDNSVEQKPRGWLW